MGQGSPSKLGQSMQSGAPQGRPQGAPQQGMPLGMPMPAGKGGQVFQPQQGPGQGRIQVDNSQRPPGSEMDYGFRPQMGDLGQGVFDAKSQPANNQTGMQNVFAQYMKMQQGGSAPMAPQGQQVPQGQMPQQQQAPMGLGQQMQQGQMPPLDGGPSQVPTSQAQQMQQMQLQQRYAQMRPPAPNAQQITPEDPRMQAMRNLQRTGGTSIWGRSANVKNY